MKKDLEKIMTAFPVSVTPNHPLSDVKMLFDNSQFHHLLVVDDDQLVGVISDRDLLHFLSKAVGKPDAMAFEKTAFNQLAKDIMTTKPFTLKESDDITDAIRMFVNEPISCIPIVNSNNNPLGIVSWQYLTQAKHINRLPVI